ncbi:reverse transcriptase domain-containing protein [Mucilaginibacter sp. RB4R14]|uniref:reverse transcriptase domain-containing protein n=1 Tax=Mucilaginibacter aurantiaciroseus TaxID=2949308 RepID=UPI00209169F4|nr:reverse transcriptase domain-containing protein [Mucilaginibacter aurantiaciroseus]MCO5936613.1 reverse transcriptase domain-containing protein [Mucilaginibacter aurantiaciroseus]
MDLLNLWFKPKPYIHFSPKIIKSDIRWLQGSLRDSNWVAKHAFFPLIHKILYQRKFRRHSNKSIKRRIKLETKKRHIYYATHLDTHVYAYYANKLNELYITELEEDDQLSSSVIAYRRIAKENSKGNKSNIEFAHEVFKYIKDSKRDCMALTFDIKSFFDDLDHKKLKQAWCKLLGLKSLPEDHLNIYRSLTNFKYVEESDLLLKYNIKHRNDLRQLKTKSLGLNKDFRVKFVDQKLIKSNSKVNPSNKIIGIPQGTPLSAFLSNLYLLEFDREVLRFLSNFDASLYRRYSDDIVIICNPLSRDEIESFIYDKIHKDYNLIIQPEKTECVNFTLSNDELVSDKALNYLGFSFNGTTTFLKPASLAGYYRTIKTYIKQAARRANRRKAGKNDTIFKKKIYKLGHLYKRNYFNYAKRASLVMDDEQSQIRGQVKNHWKIIHKELAKRSKS